MPTIIIAAPMQQELTVIRAAFHECYPEATSRSAFGYSFLRVDSHDYLFIEAGIGKMHMTRTMTRLFVDLRHRDQLTEQIEQIEQIEVPGSSEPDCKPLLAILFGTAGALHEFPAGTVHAADCTATYDYGFRGADGFISCEPGTVPLPGYTHSPSRHSPSQRLLDLFAGSSPLLATAFASIVSGDAFMADPQTVTRLVDDGWDLIDMESAAFAQTCQHFDQDWFVLRAITDQADELSPAGFIRILNGLISFPAVRQLPRTIHAFACDLASTSK
ncbi:MAG: 5-methylthioadenosine nucleosidase/S-adenosylhomocysteine nucleosidase [Rhizobacter sp.]|nr:5-methylthioadenosine nucleosidase/S-adenosylhomocysteine nucleosidase [Rhizobacter sp.]